MSLKCFLNSPELKCWGRVIHTLASEAEDDIHFEFTTESLILRTYDSGYTICCSCTFNRSFFASFDVREDNLLKCKIPSKCLLKPFKSLRFLAKCAEGCEILLDPLLNNFIVLIPCRGGVQLRYNLNLSVEEESHELDVDYEVLRNCISIEPDLMLKSLANFSSAKGFSDLTIKVEGNRVMMKNCVNDLLTKEGKVYTELTLNSVDFSIYDIELDSDITFPMREFKTFVSFAENMKTTLSLHFETDQPLLVKAESDSGLYCTTLVMVTRSMSSPPVEAHRKKPHKSKQSSSNKKSNNRKNAIDHVGESSSTSSQRISHTSSNSISQDVRLSDSPSNENHRLSEDSSQVHAEEPMDLDNVIIHENSVMAQDHNHGNSINNQRLFSPSTAADHNFDDDDFEDNILGRGITMSQIFPRLGEPFDPNVELPGYNNIIVGASDEEDD